MHLSQTSTFMLKQCDTRGKNIHTHLFVCVSLINQIDQTRNASSLFVSNGTVNMQNHSIGDGKDDTNVLTITCKVDISELKDFTAKFIY